ncbi:amino acid permease [Priestia endophytica]|jgi:amino acid transporter, AAT family|uniref:Amino acid transporter, AAT family n=1 Tax=Priestia endophytica DSM 13796 TaxID=1121089 RepID=A0A1I6C4E2_9BACI|nr:amino acid permease [Priestia endophytica]KYG34076.1 GABA permease (4-amino butyrate transport carrier) [Priestia endophytica]MBG9810217.1 GABA permease (4-amino butyrate transport carrier) [Priestia endophytica]SFQ88061.1 amino acid transporter, AAT family [Priestia endophytica DSM 13796]
MESSNSPLQKKLLPRHISLMAMGGAIGTGIFKGSAETVTLAGPGVIFTYMFAGILLLVVMGAIAEMAIAYPDTNMKGFVRLAFGKRVSFVTGWLYCFMWLSVCVIEVIVAGSFFQYWFPYIPLWVLSLGCAVLIIGINMMNVKNYGEFEFWFAGIKIAMIMVFIVLGASILFGITPSNQSNYLQNFTEHGGFFPNGSMSIISALLIVMFSYGGSELIGLTITEAKDAERILPKVIKSFIWRIVLFYTLPILIICGLIPWNEISDQSSPFVQVLSMSGLQGAAHIMNFILITAVLSAANSGIYGCTRMLHSLALGGEAPQTFSYVSKNGVPSYSLMLSAIVLIVGSMITYVAQDQVFTILMAVPGFVVSLIWISICLSQLKLRKSYPKEPSFKLWGFPYVTASTAVVLIIICIMFVLNEQNRTSIIACLLVLAILVGVSIIKFKRVDAQKADSGEKRIM